MNAAIADNADAGGEIKELVLRRPVSVTATCTHSTWPDGTPVTKYLERCDPFTLSLPAGAVLLGVQYVGRATGRTCFDFIYGAAWYGVIGEAAASLVEATGMGREWSTLFPDGRNIFYEGGDPDGFRKEMSDLFGFDPAGDDWGRWIDMGPCYPNGGFRSYGFHCPGKLMDEVYGSRRWPLGS